ncbi:MAG: EF-hand domain-containing protein [Pseudomonadota bacterium]
MRKFTLLVAAGTLALGGAGIAMAKHHADQASAHRGPGFEHADMNADGVVTLDEAKTKAGERFTKMDVDEDGALSPSDREARAQQRFAEADTNADGEISAEEMTAAHEKREAERAARRAERQAMMFERLDMDKSGGLSQAEMEAGKALRGEARRAGRGGRPDEANGPRMGRRGPPGMRMLRTADTNQDNAISREEFDAMIEARFAEVDTDGSGTITAAENEAAKAQFKGRRGPRGPGQGASAAPPGAVT